MPDLSLKSSHAYWDAYHDKSVYKIILHMESIETWSKDGNPELEQALEELGKELDDIEDVDFSYFGNEDLFIRILANIKESRALRLLQSLDAEQPGTASKILAYAEEKSIDSDDHYGIFLRRNLVFERFRLISRIFSKQRFNLVLKALEGEEL